MRSAFLKAGLSGAWCGAFLIVACSSSETRPPPAGYTSDATSPPRAETSTPDASDAPFVSDAGPDNGKFTLTGVGTGSDANLSMFEAVAQSPGGVLSTPRSAMAKEYTFHFGDFIPAAGKAVRTITVTVQQYPNTKSTYTAATNPTAVAKEHEAKVTFTDTADASKPVKTWSSSTGTGTVEIAAVADTAFSITLNGVVLTAENPTDASDSPHGTITVAGTGQLNPPQ